MTVQLLLALSILVILHELGHYVAARLFGIKVEKFYLFFDAWGVKLFSFKKGETEFGIGWLPLGGYVKIAGMIDESMDTEAMKKPPQPWEFRSKPAWKRLIVMLAGVTVNVILGIVIFSIMTFRYGENYLPIEQVKYGIVAHELGQEIGLQTGDKIIAINGQKVKRFSELTSTKVLLGNNVVLNVERNGKMIDVPLPVDFLDRWQETKGTKFIDYRFTFYVKEVMPGSNAQKAGLLANDKIISINNEPVNFFDEIVEILGRHKAHEINLIIDRKGKEIKLLAQVDDDGKLGFIPEITDDFKFKHIEYGLLQSIVKGNSRSWEILFANIIAFGKIIKGELSFSKSVAGPIEIAKHFGGVWVWYKFWLLTGMLSMILAFINVLPIPALDGGHAAFLSIEAVSGKKFSDKFMINAQIVGMVILFSFMAFVIRNDVVKLF
ncbi:MAG: RIP metalloprotease RseP [Bacteroidetes bacterium]|nr:RIP metalloprotease RseP [Bacteroidota bacterium]